ncbi:MAG TPA: hypothetical protein VHE35_04430, partial [Kofleriaceae bacterium]|nr:hypothetical protein [Kofleriaceae bacterium]
GSGSAAPAAEGAGAGSASTTPAGPPPIMVPTQEKLPPLGKLDPVVVERHDAIVRSGDSTPIGESAELANALFNELAVGGVADRIFEVRASVVDPMPQYALVQLTGKDLADVAEFDKQADRLVERLSLTRGYELLADFLRERCDALTHDGKIKPTWGYLQNYDDQGHRLPITYQPCISLQKPKPQ